MTARPHASTLQKLAVALAAIVVSSAPAHDPRATAATHHDGAKAVQAPAHLEGAGFLPGARHEWP